MMRTAGWKLYVIPLVVVGLLLMPLFFVPDYHGPVYPIRIDGVFDDWTGVPRVVGSGAAVNANVDITQAAVTDNLDFLSFYMQVRGRALEGDPSASRTMDAYFVFIDTDRSASTGYQVQGLGADRLIEIDGWGDTADQLHKLSVQQKWPEMAKLVTEEMVHAFAAAGTYDEIASVIKKRFAGVNRLSFDMSIKNDHDRGVLKEIVQDLRRP